MNSSLYQERGEGEPREASEPDRPGNQGGPRTPERGDQEDRRRGGVRRAGQEAPGALPRLGLGSLPNKGSNSRCAMSLRV